MDARGKTICLPTLTGYIPTYYIYSIESRVKELTNQLLICKQQRLTQACTYSQSHHKVCKKVIVQTKTKGIKPNFFTLCMLCNFSCFFCCHLQTFFKINVFKKILSGTLSKCQMVWIQIRIDIMSVLIRIQTVCKGY